MAASAKPILPSSVAKCAFGSGSGLGGGAPAGSAPKASDVVVDSNAEAKLLGRLAELACEAFGSALGTESASSIIRCK
eukprot:Skav216054  [mRNA]  locus=scaffold2261:20431:23978:+ [translate_table: standard]